MLYIINYLLNIYNFYNLTNLKTQYSCALYIIRSFNK